MIICSVVFQFKAQRMIIISTKLLPVSSGLTLALVIICDNCRKTRLPLGLMLPVGVFCDIVADKHG